MKASEYDREELRRKVKALYKSFYDYTDDNNPFGDPDLSKPFVWVKKIEKMRRNDMEPYLDSKTILLKLRAMKEDIDKIRKTRMKREEMKETNDESNKPEEQTYDEWCNKDEKFHLAQEKLRNEIRIKQGREKPVDFLNKVLNIWCNFAPIPSDFYEILEYQKPYLLYDLLDKDALNDLNNDLETQIKIDKKRLSDDSFVCFFLDIASNFKQHHELPQDILDDFISYWQCMKIIIESYIYPEKNINNLDIEVRDQINDVLKDYTNEKEMEELEKMIEDDLKEMVLSADIQFWNNVLNNLRILKCKKKLEILYNNFAEKNKEKLENLQKLSDQIVDSTILKLDIETQDVNYEDEGNLSPLMYESDEEVRKNALGEHDYLIKISETRKTLLAQLLNKWKGSVNPQQIKKKEEKLEIKEKTTVEEAHKEQVTAYDSEEEVERILGKKRKNNNIVPSTVGTYKNQTELLLGTGCYPIDTIKASRFNLKDEVYDYNLTQEMLRIQNQELGEGESIFNDVVQLTNVRYPWKDLYKPRKPRYFNRIKMGYEWNKYHQLHYDLDNPPPKIIQGYKFNLFYPDLIDKTKTPQYTVERSDTPDTCILRFHAGPPYEDIGFKIVNREWDMTEKADFTNIFDRGILYLYFNFKRYRYKR